MRGGVGLAAALAVSLAGGPGLAATDKAPALPTGWRLPSTAEAAALGRAADKALGQPAHQMLAVRADFDGDGRTDRAAFLLKGNRFALFVARASVGRWTWLDDGETRDRLAVYTLAVIPPGAFEPTCMGGLGEPGEPCRGRFRTRRPAITLTVQESAEIIYWWDGRRFDKDWLSD